MKIFSVVGVRKSGKTTTVEILIEELKKRGFTVGTVKTINCPMFSMEEKETSNTYRHKKAGADVVCASAGGETAFIYSRGMEQNRIFEKLDTDYLILEGDYQADVPRIVCAHTEQEVLERKNGYTFLVAGRIADVQSRVCGIDAVSACRDRERLVRAVLDEVSDTLLPVSLSPIPEEARYFCRHVCRKACALGGETAPSKISEEEEQKESDAKARFHGPHIFLTGEKQVGKSTIWREVLRRTGISCTGFVTLPFEINGEKRGYYMHGLGKLPRGYANDVPISIRSRERGMTPVTEAFDTFGTALLETACEEKKAGEGYILLDELGRLERNAESFQKAVLTCLDSGCRVLGVLQQTDTPFVEKIKERADVMIYTVTKENREELADRLEKELIREEAVR